MGTAIFWGILIFCAYWKFFRKKPKPPTVVRTNIKQKVLNEEAAIIQPIQSAEALFDITPFEENVPILPATSDSIFKIKEDNELLTNFTYTLNWHQSKVQKIAETAITRFEADHSELIHQQIQIHKRIFQSKKILDRFYELKSRPVSAKDIPDMYLARLPEKPTYPSLEELKRKYWLPSSQGVGSGIGKIANARGMSVQGKLLMTAGLVTIAALRGKSANSQLKRTLEEARGNIANYIVILKNTVVILKERHNEIVVLSSKLKLFETDLIERINEISLIDPQHKMLNEVTAKNQEQLFHLHAILLKAEQHSINTI